MSHSYLTMFLMFLLLALVTSVISHNECKNVSESLTASRTEETADAISEHDTMRESVGNTESAVNPQNTHHDFSGVHEDRARFVYNPQVIINPLASGAGPMKSEICCNCSAVREVVSKELEVANCQLEHLHSAVLQQTGVVSSELGDIKSQLKQLSTAISDLGGILRNSSDKDALHKDCSDVLARGITDSGVYMIQPLDNGRPIRVYCDMETDGGGWTVFQRRKDGTVDFYRDFETYRKGFGNLEGEFWLGNDNLHRITSQDDYNLRVDLADFEGNSAYAVYDTFRVADASDNYRLTVEGYSGTAGDSLYVHKNQMFSTKDRDNDIWESNCAQTYHGAWWYSDCHDSNLNGEYLGRVTNRDTFGLVWQHWKGNSYSLKTSELKMRISGPS